MSGCQQSPARAQSTGLTHAARTVGFSVLGASGAWVGLAGTATCSATCGTCLRCIGAGLVAASVVVGSRILKLRGTLGQRGGAEEIER